MMDARKDRIGEYTAEHAPPGRSRRWVQSPRTCWTGWTGRNGPPPGAAQIEAAVRSWWARQQG
jgi:hypothetical protein